MKQRPLMSGKAFQPPVQCVSNGKVRSTTQNRALTHLIVRQNCDSVPLLHLGRACFETPMKLSVFLALSPSSFSSPLPFLLSSRHQPGYRRQWPRKRWEECLREVKECWKMTGRRHKVGLLANIAFEIEFCFTLFRDWLVKYAPFSQPMGKPKPIMPRSDAFSRAWRRLHLFASNSDWFIVLFTFVVIGQSDYFGFGRFSHIALKITVKNGKACTFPVEVCDWRTKQ